MIHAKQVTHFGPVVPEAPYVHKYVRPDGPDDPVLLDRELVDDLVKRARLVSREVVVERYRGTGPCEPVSSERTELVYLVEGSAELAQLDKLIAAAKATRADRDPSSPCYDRYRPSSPCYDGPYSP